MFDALKKFWSSHTITTHSLMVAVATLTTLYTAVPPFQALVNQLYAATPAWAHQVTTAVIGIAVYYNLVPKKPAPPAA